MSKLYKFVTTERINFETGITIGFKVEPGGDIYKAIKDKNGKTLALIMYNGGILVHPGYAWDGCSPKWAPLDLFYLGTPDGRAINGEQILKYPSCLHDILYQASKIFHDNGWEFITRKQADQVFHQEMKRVGFKLHWLWYGAVRLFSWMFWGKRRKV